MKQGDYKEAGSKSAKLHFSNIPVIDLLDADSGSFLDRRTRVLIDPLTQLSAAGLVVQRTYGRTPQVERFRTPMKIQA
jgi:hypothetical protein